MQTSPFDPTYPHHLQHHHATGAYGTMAGFESTGLKFHHGGYADAASDAAAFYQNYVSPTPDYAPREPPSYAESTTPAPSSTLFHPGFVHTSTADYYKLGGGGGGGGGVNVNGASLRQLDMGSDYYAVPKSSVVTDNFLMKQENPNSCSEGGAQLLEYNNVRYSADTLQQLHHHHHQHQQQQQQRQQLQHHQQQHQHLQHIPNQQPKPQLQLTSELVPTEAKAEAESHADYKTPADINAATTPTHIGSLHHHHQLQQQQQQQGAEEPGDLPQPREISDPSPPPVPGQRGHVSRRGSRTHDRNRHQLFSHHHRDLASPGRKQRHGGGGGGGGGEGGVGGEESGKSSNEVKPTLSYIALIAKSILESPQRRLNLGSIYGWIEKNFPYYRNRGQGWRNSVRHNLSLNDCFIKAGRCEDGKGNYWAIHPANMQDFLRGDFRQRRRSRRRGRKKDCELGMYHHHHQFTNGYLGAATASGVAAAAAAAAGGSLGVGGFAPSAATLYSPYTEAERRAYRLDEALLRQSMNNPFLKWYHQSSPYPPATSPSSVNTGVYSGVGAVAGVGVSGARARSGLRPTRRTAARESTR